MKPDDIRITAAAMAILRREQSVLSVADRFGVTEGQVLEWQDVFVIGGTTALQEFRAARPGVAMRANLVTSFPPEQ